MVPSTGEVVKQMGGKKAFDAKTKKCYNKSSEKSRRKNKNKFLVRVLKFVV